MFSNSLLSSLLLIAFTSISHAEDTNTQTKEAEQALPTAPINVGDKAPELESVDQDNNKISLKALYKEGATLIYFYPKSDTPGCTKQACNLRDAFEDLKKANITIIGVSNDTVKDQKAFQEKYKLPFTLLADTEQAVIKAFGVPVMREKYASRQTFLIQDGVIIWRDLKAAPLTQAQNALAALKAHQEESKKTK